MEETGRPRDRARFSAKPLSRKRPLQVRRSASVPSPRRTAMGEYLPPPGGRPLSSYGKPTPSPAHYRPNTAHTMPQSPRHSIHGLLYPLKKPPSPSPCEYNTREDALWKDNYKTIAMKQKDITWPYDTRKESHITSSPGAGHYLLQDGDTGSAPKRSMSARHREGVHAGYPNSLVQPVDTYGFKTPSATYRPQSERGPSHYVGLNLKKYEGDTLGPGPAAYSMPSPVLPSPVIGEKLSLDWEPHYPAPNEYELPDSIDETRAKSFGIRHKSLKSMETPAPSQYGTLCRPSTALPHSINYRPFSTPVEKRPSPAEYSLAKKSDLPHPPEYSCRPNCLPVFPDILLYPEHDKVETPGAGSYEYDREFGDNDKPAYSISLPLPEKPNANPGPNRYRVRHESLSKFRRAPSYSIGRRSSGGGERSRSPSPGPAAYNPRPTSAGAAFMTPRREMLRSHPTPAPNTYSVQRGMTKRGGHTGPAASMKGRPTPALYSGFPSSHMGRLSTCS